MNIGKLLVAVSLAAGVGAGNTAQDPVNYVSGNGGRLMTYDTKEHEHKSLKAYQNAKKNCRAIYRHKLLNRVDDVAAGNALMECTKRATKDFEYRRARIQHNRRHNR